MRKFIFILIIVSSFIGCLFAEEEQEQLKFQLLNAEDYHLSLSISTVIERFYANLEFTVAQEELADVDYFSFPLSKLAYLERVKVDGQSVRFSYTTELDPRHFDPELAAVELLDPESPVYWVSLGKELFEAKSGNIKINLEYKMLLPPWTMGENNREELVWNTGDFFYPRNLNALAELHITLLTTTLYNVDRADSFSDKGNLRTIKRKIVDIPGQEAKLTLYRS